MCGRYTLAGKPIDLEKHLRSTLLLGQNFRSRWNISPGTEILAVTNAAPALIQQVKWGLRPFWTKPGERPTLLINAREDSLRTKPGFKRYLNSKRCLVPASGFYEWKTLGKTKQPWFIHVLNEPIFCFAAIWESHTTEQGNEEVTVALITTEPNDLMAPIHNRMPVILPKEKYTEWLSGNPSPEALLLPYPADEMEAWPVSSLVNRSGTEGPELIEPIDAMPPPIGGLFNLID